MPDIFGKQLKSDTRTIVSTWIGKEIVRCGGLDGSVNLALDYFDASINRISAWVVGFRNFQKALLNALLTPNETLKQLQDEGRMTELMVKQEEIKTLPFGDVWAEYCEECGAPKDGTWFGEIEKYEETVLTKRVEEGKAVSVLDTKFVQGFIRMCNDGWEQGWHERNGGNLSYRIKDEDVAEVKEFLHYENEWKPIGTKVPGLAEIFPRNRQREIFPQCHH